MKNNFINYTLSMAVFVLLLPNCSKAQGLQIGSGSYFVASGAVSIILDNGGIENNGNFIKGNSSVIFTGNTATANSFVSGSTLPDFYNFTVNKTAKGVQLFADISVSNTLKMQSGDSLFLNNHNIDLGSSGAISGEANTRRITGLTGGYIKANTILNVATAVNPGNMGLEFTSPVNMGNTIIKRFCHRPTAKCINRYFEIIPTNNSSLNATLTCYYFDAELAGISELDLNMHSSLDSGVFWVLDGKTAINTSLNFVTMNLYSRLQLITLADIYMTLPVTELNINAYLQSKHSIIEWTGNYNANNSSYEIERSVNGKDFNVIGIVPQRPGYNAGFYSFTDEQPAPGFNYYRLKQISNTNRLLYSKAVMLQFDQPAASSLFTYPNPAREQFKTIVQAAAEKDTRLILFDITGKPVLIKQTHLVKGFNEIVWDIHQLPAGSYYVGTADGYFKSEKLIKL